MSRSTDRVLDVNVSALGFGLKAPVQRFQLGAGGILVPQTFAGVVTFPPFNPLVLPSGQHWTAVWDMASVTQAGGLISAVADLTGNGHTLTGSGGTKPGYTAMNPAGNNQPSADFSGTKVLTSGAMGMTTGDFTAVIVGSAAWMSDDTVFLASNPDGTRVMSNGAGGGVFVTGDATSTLVFAADAVDSQVAILIAELSGATSSFAWSETTPSANAANTPDLTGASFTVGYSSVGASQAGSTFWCGVLAGALSPTDKAYLNAGFSTRFGVTIGP